MLPSWVINYTCSLFLVTQLMSSQKAPFICLYFHHLRLTLDTASGIINWDNWSHSFSKGFQMIMQKPFMKTCGSFMIMFIEWSLAVSVWTENCQRTTFFSASGPCAVGHMFISCFSQHPALRFSKRHFAHGLTRVISFSLIRDCLLLCTCEQAMQMCSTFRTHTLFLALLEYGIKRVTRPVPKSNKAPFYDSAFTGFFSSYMEPWVIPHDKAYSKSVSLFPFIISYCHFTNWHKVLFE